MRRPVFVFAFSVLALTSAAGCKRLVRGLAKKAVEGSGAQSEQQGSVMTPPQISVSDTEVSFSGLPTKGRAYLKRASYNITFSDLPAGAKLTVDGKPVASSGGGLASASVDLSDRLAQLAPREAFDSSAKLDPKIKVEIEFGPSAKVTFSAPPVAAWIGLKDLYKSAADSPVALAKPAPGAEHTIVSLLSTAPEAIGPAKTLRDIDWVAVEENLPPRAGKTCTGYKKTGDDKAPEKALVVEMVDQKVTVYDATTSKVIDAKEFRAKNECPMMAFGGNARSYPSSEDQKSWLRTLRAAAKKKK